MPISRACPSAARRPGERRRLASVVIGLVWLILLGASTRQPSASETGAGQSPAAASSALTGTLAVVWGDPPPGSGAPGRIEFTLYADDGSERLLDTSQAGDSESLVRFDRKRVTVTPASSSTGAGMSSTASRLAITGLQLVDTHTAGGATTSVTGNNRWVSIPCRFSDSAAEPKSLAYLQGMMGTTYPGLGHYWREASYNIANIDSSTSVNWVTLPQPRSYYVYDSDSDGSAEFDFSRATTDCIAAGDASIDFTQYYGISLLFNGELDGASWGGSRYLALDGQPSRRFAMVWLPPWGYANQSVFAHEMGHGFGLSHSSGSYGQTYDNQWDVMSDTWSGQNRLNGRDTTFGVLAQHPISAQKDQLGWIDVTRKGALPYGGQATIALERLAQPLNGGYFMFTTPTVNSAHFVIEARRLVGYDSSLPGDAVVIHSVNETTGKITVVDVDGNGNTGDGGAMWLPGEVFSDSASGITVIVNSASATGYSVTVRHNGATHVLTVQKTGGGSGTVTSTPVGVSCGSTCSAALPADVSIQLSATPASNSYLAAWSGGCDSSGAVFLDADKTCTARFELLTLALALDSPYTAWTAGTDVPWFPQTTVTYDSVDAAQSGAIAVGQTSTLRRKYEGSNGTQIVYSWRIDSTSGTLAVYLDSQLQPLTSVTGTTGWSRVTLTLSATGPHTITWKFTKTAAATSGADAAWVDDVEFPTTTFTDDPIVTRGTMVKAVHIAEMRAKVATLRSRYGLSAQPWTDASLPAGTRVKAIHIAELRTALADVYTAASASPPTYTRSTLSARSTTVAAIDVMELRAAIAGVW